MRSFVSRLHRPACIGLAVGALYFAADLLGTGLAVGPLADMTASGLLLLAMAALVSCFLGVAVTIVAALVLRPWLPSRRPTKVMAALALLGFVCITTASYAMRIGRRPPLLGPPSAAPYPNARNVLLIVVDALRADTLYGPNLSFPLTPELGAWSGDAVVFTDAEAAASWTIPSVATILTGMLPERHYASRGYLPDWAPTLAKRLRAAGYDTSALVDNALLEKRNGYTAGFATYFQKSAFRFAFSLPSFRLLPSIVGRALRDTLHVYEHGAPRLTDEALRIIAEPRTRPLFMYVHYMEPHEPYYEHPEFGPDPADAEPADVAALAERLRNNPSATPTATQLRFLRHRYNGEVRALDAPLVRLVRSFKERFGNDAIVAVTADHGEEFLDHGNLCHGMTLHRELVHVPLIVQGGALQAVSTTRQRINTPISLVDLTPTLLDLAGVPATVGAEGLAMDGVSWLPRLRDEPTATPPAPLFASQTQYQQRIYRWREDNRVLIITFRAGQQTRQLFDLTTDPSEHTDIASQAQSEVGTLDNHMAASNETQVRGRDPRPNTSQSDIESLRGLGYVQ